MKISGIATVALISVLAIGADLGSETAKNGKPPLDAKGMVTDAFKEKITEEWVPYRFRERKKGVEHTPPREFIYGPTWASVDVSWRISFEIKCLDSWSRSVERETVQRALEGPKDLNDLNETAKTLAKEWLNYRINERIAGKEHEIPANFNFGPHWLRVDATERPSYDRICNAVYDELVKKGIIDLLIKDSKMRREVLSTSEKQKWTIK
jgi:hypothetical protein